MKFTSIMVPGVDVIRVLHQYRSEYAKTGQFPFLIGDEETLDYIKYCVNDNTYDPSEMIRESLDFDIHKWLEEQLREAESDEFSAVEKLGVWKVSTSNRIRIFLFNAVEKLGVFPSGIKGQNSLRLHKDILTGKIFPEVCLGLAKIDQPWHLPAVIGYGGCNMCPEPVIQSAFFRYWQEKYGAEIAGVSDDTVECFVRRRPWTRKAAIELAWEQYWYCNDIVDQGCDTISELAADLMVSPDWFFWWD